MKTTRIIISASSTSTSTRPSIQRTRASSAWKAVRSPRLQRHVRRCLLGTVTFAVFADLVPATGGSGTPRTDLVITDAEITQAVQHFRSALHLDSANVFPDNSIRLCEDKATGIRLWVDYDRNSGLTPINTLSGTLTVTGQAGSATLLPLNSIVAKYESQVSRANASETLNFIIPEGLCRGMVTISARVFAQGNAAEFSDFFQRTLVFEPMTPIRLFAVGINYTGPDTIPGMPTGAPQPADFATLFTTTELLYPIPSVMQTGFMTMDYNEEIKSDISKGCDKFSDLRDEIKRPARRFDRRLLRSAQYGRRPRHRRRMRGRRRRVRGHHRQDGHRGA